MMAFNWRRFCDEHRIRYVTHGPNTARGEISIHCPMCGEDDPSEHLGLNLSTGKWGCWRRPSHRGIRPHRLIMRLIGCGYEVADSYVMGGRELSQFDRLAEDFMRDAQGDEVGAHELKFPSEFKRLKNLGRGRHYFKYMVERRGFQPRAVEAITRRFKLHYCDGGYWRGRIIFPIYYMEELVGWTGRTIYDAEELRYMSLSDKPPKRGMREPQPLARMNVKDLIGNYDQLIGHRSRVVSIVEGPMDGVKTDYYGYDHGIRATWLFGTGITEHQRLLIEEVREWCDELIIIPDTGALLNEFDLTSELAHLRPKVLRVPKGTDDPGDFTKKSFARVFRPFLS